LAACLGHPDWDGVREEESTEPPKIPIEIEEIIQPPIPLPKGGGR